MISNPTATPEHFHQFGVIAGRTSPLYGALSHSIADDPDLLALAAYARPGQPGANMLLGAVHYLLLKGLSDPLASYYSDLTASPAPPDGAFPTFRDFCLRHADALRAVIASRAVQTNEVRRCALLMPAFAYVAAQAGKPFILIEFGTSAGLNLLWDHYGYLYTGDAIELTVGSAQSGITLRCALHGNLLPPVPQTLPQISARLGIDLNPIDLHDPDAVLWLRALIWPEHLERARLLDQSIAIAQTNPTQIIGGDALDVLPLVLESLPQAHPDSALCLFHSFVVYQFTSEMREQLETLLKNVSLRQPLYRISLEYDSPTSGAMLRLFTYSGGTARDDLLAACADHGDTLTWRMPIT